MNNELFNKVMNIENYAIFDDYCKAYNVLRRSYTALCSISGGSDSDIVLDIIHNLDESGKVTYYWIDTGLEYKATKEHLDFLEQKCGIEIAKAQGKYTGRKPIPIDWNRFEKLYGEWKSSRITARDFICRMELSSNTFYRRVREYEVHNGITEPASA